MVDASLSELTADQRLKQLAAILARRLLPEPWSARSKPISFSNTTLKANFAARSRPTSQIIAKTSPYHLSSG
ncbi:MAG: hypothetical protein KatS3mg113_0813 [Planctomycetaceae bacterium]|nr:MAG: hypothetical protein KatS3mg113_0813 [Planctomycetaceae bacterium]